MKATGANSVWNPITALSENSDGTLNVHWDDYSSGFDCIMERDQLLIQIGGSDQTATVPKQVPPLRFKNYKVSIPIPKDSIPVPRSIILAPGTKLQACFANRWNPITFLSHAHNGTLNVRWDDYGSGFDCSMVRSQLIIKKSEFGGVVE